MSSISDAPQEPKDRTPWIWLGIITLVVVMVAALWISSRRPPPTSQVNARDLLIKCNNSDPADRARALELVTDLRQRILDGESFKKLAREFSDDETSRARGGELGYYDRGQFEPEFEAYVWSAPVGEVSEITQTSYGFHIIEVLDRFLSEGDRYEMELEQRVRQGEDEAASGGVESPAP